MSKENFNKYKVKLKGKVINVIGVEVPEGITKFEYKDGVAVKSVLTIEEAHAEMLLNTFKHDLERQKIAPKIIKQDYKVVNDKIVHNIQLESRKDMIIALKRMGNRGVI